MTARLVSTDQVRAVLREHWLTGVCCDHDAGTNAAACFCALWRSQTVNSPVAAADAWIEHIIERLDAEPSAEPAVA